ncbi:MAG: L-rhamnose catabolism isomerase [Planctomycetes bacterium]|nr:L-rhamnose catabolism isomerase [Planctomycetota bacterium]
MTEPFRIAPEFLAEHNRARAKDLAADYEHLGRQLARRGLDVERITAAVQRFCVAIPSWGVGTGGTRFARFAGPGEPRDVFEKIADCGTIQQLCRATPAVSLHIPWDEPEDPAALRAAAAREGLGFDAMNSNTFQDQPGQRLSYKFGSLTHTDAAVRQQAIEHNRHVIEVGRRLGSRSITVWIADGANFPGQQNHRDALSRYLESLRAIYAALPADWTMYLEHKLYEPAFYATVNNDWGTSFWCASQLGAQCRCLVDLGHHAPNTNIEMVVARLVQFGKLGGFHFNDSKYGDDDLDSGAIHPFQLFLVFHELVDAQARDPSFAPAYMLDQSHNVTDPIESLIGSAGEVQRAFAQALLVDRRALAELQLQNDALLAHRALKAAFQTDVSPILAMARVRNGGAIDPIAAYRQSGYRAHKAVERPAAEQRGSGIV